MQRAIKQVQKAKRRKLRIVKSTDSLWVYGQLCQLKSQNWKLTRFAGKIGIQIRNTENVGTYVVSVICNSLVLFT